jgi:hypothetical protein
MSRRYHISGQFILSAGAFIAVILSFTAAALAIGPRGNFVYVIVLFLVFFAALFIPLSFITRPLIERDAVDAYLDGLERKIKGWDFCEQDLSNLKRLEAVLFKRKSRRHFPTLARIMFLISEMERFQKARASFFWEDPQGPKH